MSPCKQSTLYFTVTCFLMNIDITLNLRDTYELKNEAANENNVKMITYKKAESHIGK